MNGHLHWTGVGSDTRSINGKGEFEVRNGDVFAIQIFGPLSDLLDKMLPGIGYHVARKASASFTLRDGVIRTPDFYVDGGPFGMVGPREAQWLANRIEFVMRIDASGAGFVRTPFYKFFEYKAEGSLSHPTWRPKNF